MQKVLWPGWNICGIFEKGFLLRHTWIIICSWQGTFRKIIEYCELCKSWNKCGKKYLQLISKMVQPEHLLVFADQDLTVLQRSIWRLLHVSPSLPSRLNGTTLQGWIYLVLPRTANWRMDLYVSTVTLQLSFASSLWCARPRTTSQTWMLFRSSLQRWLWVEQGEIIFYTIVAMVWKKNYIREVKPREI
jgi:hypothetical protein